MTVQDLEKATEDEGKIEKIKSDIDKDSDNLTEINPKIEEYKKKIKAVENKIVESGGEEYKKMKEQAE